MREILFKAKRIDRNEWVYGSYLPKSKMICTEITYHNSTEYIDLFVDPETLCEFTGWYDQHKTKIFENDVVEFVSGTSLHRYLIWWQREGNMLTAVPLDGITFNGSDYWNGKFPKFDYSTFCLMMLDPYGDFRDIRVIGNIHDNPELLEE